jgi:hypothetical protein
MDQTRVITVTSRIVDNQNAFEHDWKLLEDAPNVSFFQTSAWLKPWWKYSGKFFKTQQITLRQNKAIHGLAFLSYYTSRRRHFFISRAVHLNENRTPGYDFIIEHNGILIKDISEEAAADAMIQHILQIERKTDEIVLSGINQSRYNIFKDIGEKYGLLPITIRTSKFSYVDLSKIRRDNTAYLDCLSRNTRSKIRRSLNAYESEFGDVVLEEALSTSQALEYLQGLKHLHQNYWEEKGKPGSFSNSHWEGFITSMVKEGFDDGKIQILRISAGGHDIGYILNLIHNGYVNMLQSGFKYHPNNKMKPGYVSHYLAINHNIQKNNRVYDFLAGKSQYKDSLATNDGKLYWLTLQKKCPKYFLENTMVKAVRSLKHAGNK